MSITVNREAYPGVFRALRALDLAAGHFTRLNPAPESYSVPDSYLPLMCEMSEELEALTDEEMEIFVDGPDDEVKAIAHRSEALTRADELLNDRFSGEF